MLINLSYETLVFSCILSLAVAQSSPPIVPATVAVDPPQQSDSVESFVRDDAAKQASVAGDELLDLPLTDPPINASSSRAAPLGRSLFEVVDRRTEKRQRNDEQYRFTYSHDQVQVFDYRLFADHFPRDDVNSLLRNAVQFASTQDASQIRTTFESSFGNLTLAVDAFGGSPTAPSFNWAAYGAAASILLNDTVKLPADTTESWVGFIRDPSNAVVAQLAITSEVFTATADPAPAAVPAAPSTLPRNRKRDHLAKRVITRGRPVQNLRNRFFPYTLDFGPRPNLRVRNPADLVEVMEEVVTTFRLRRFQDEVYTEFFTRDIPDRVISFDRFVDFLNEPEGLSDAHTFAFRLRPGRSPLSGQHMLRIAQEIRLIAQENREPLGIQGVLRRGDEIVADWTLGGRPEPETTEGAFCPLQQRGRGGRRATVNDRALVQDVLAERACIFRS